MLLAIASGGSRASADDEPGPAGAAAAGETIVIYGATPPEADRDRTRALGDAPFVTVLHPDEHAATASVADALATSAGAQTRSLGGFGAYESVSVRGAATGHTVVLVDGVPLSRLAAVTTDLGRFALDAFAEVDLYRGAVPVELGGAGVGGAVNLVTRLGRGAGGERLALTAGGGSYGARFARARYGDVLAGGRVATAITAGYQGATGDFSYFDDNGTPLNATDDHTGTRRNNAFDQLDVTARAGAPDGSRVAGARVAWKRQGLPGSIPQPSFGASLRTLDVLADARGDHRIGAATTRTLAYGLVEAQGLDDPMGELGLGAQDRHYLTLSGGASTVWHLPVVTAGLEARGDRFRDADPERANLVGTRVGGAASIAANLALGDVIAITPAVRVELERTAPTPLTDGPQAFMPVAPRWDVVPSPRVTALAHLSPDLAVKGSTGSYVRLPTLVELFGDRGAVIGAPDLRVERGTASDVGIVWAPARAVAHGAIDRVLIETAVFGTRSRDTIALVSSVGFVARAMNIGATQSYGAELVAAARIARTVSLTASYTRLVSEQLTVDPNLFGRALPRTPAHLLYVRADVAHRLAGQDASAYADVAAQGASYLDQANVQRIPARALVGAGVRVRVPVMMRVAATATVANLLDVRIVDLPADRAIDRPQQTALTDLAGYPLPGRSLMFALDWTY